MHTVNGVASTRPIGPQIQIQKSADINSANDDTPVRCPSTTGSTKYAAIKSRTRNSAIVCNVSDHPGNVANARTAGIVAEMIDPTYGTKRRTAVSPPHNAA